MNRFRILVFLTVLGASVFSPATAQAGGVWDSDDPGHRFDIRWVGAYRSDGVMRVTIRFDDPIRPEWFTHWDDFPRVEVTLFGQATMFVPFYVSKHGRLFARFCHSGGGCFGFFHVFRPDPTMLRMWFPSTDPLLSAPLGTFFKAITTEKQSDPARVPRVIDRTVWATV